MEAIENTKIMVLIFTDHSNRSVQVRREVDNAICHGMAIIPFKLTEEMPSGSMEYYLSTLHWLDAINEPMETAIEELSKRVIAILKGEVNESTVTVNAKYLVKYKPFRGVRRTITGIASIPVFALSCMLFLIGVLGFIIPEISNINSLVTMLASLVFLIPSYAGVWMFFQKKCLRISQWLLIGVMELVVFVATCVFGNM